MSSGFGTGATQNFYSSVAHALLDATAHRALPVWLCDDAVGATECASERNESACIKHTGELFPRPLPPNTAPATHSTLALFLFASLLREGHRIHNRGHRSSVVFGWKNAAQANETNT